MKRTLIIGLLSAAVAWSGATHSALQNIENAYEIAASAMTLPQTDGGQLIVHPCSACKTVFLPTDASTQYRVGASGATVTLAEFRDAVRRNPKSLATVIYRLDNKTVSRIVLSAS
jgi:hypothetical protein